MRCLNPRARQTGLVPAFCTCAKCAEIRMARVERLTAELAARGTPRDIHQYTPRDWEALESRLRQLKLELRAC